MNQQKHLLPILIGIFGMLIFGSHINEVRDPESVKADSAEASIEDVEFSLESTVDFDPSATDPITEVSVVNTIPVRENVLIDEWSDIEDPESYQWYQDPDCPDELAWTGEEVVDPFNDPHDQFDFWNESVEFRPDGLDRAESDLAVDDVRVQESTNSNVYADLSDEGIEFITEFFEQASEADIDATEQEDLLFSDSQQDSDVEQDIVEEVQQQFLEEIEDFDESSVFHATPTVDEITVIEEFEIDFGLSELEVDPVVVTELESVIEESNAVHVEDTLETVSEVVEFPIESFDIVEEVVEFTEEAYEPTEEVLETTHSSSESRSATSLLAEEVRVADLRRFSTDDIRRSNWNRALDEIRELVTLRPYHADYHITLGLVHRNLEDQFQDGSHLQEAIRKYEEYAEFGGEEAIASLLLAEAHAASGDRQTAFELLERAASHGMNIARAVQQFPVLEKYTRDTRFVRSSLRLERYALSSVMSRDPFTGPWSRSGHHNETVFIGPLSIEEQREALADARQAMARVEYALRNRDESAAMESYAVIEKIGSTVARFDQPELAGELRSILERLDEVEDGIDKIRVTYLYEQARSKMQSMKKAFEEHDFTIVDRLHGEVSSLAFSIEEMGDSYRTASTLVVQAADQLQQRSDIVREFLAKNLSVEGVVVSDDGSHAIIDGRWVLEGGDVLDGRLDLILRDRVVILYKGERITHRFSRF